MKKNGKLYQLASELYAAHGVDTEKALAALEAIEIGIHAWQGDDVTGFEQSGNALTGGCQVTGNYPGCARTAAELMADLDYTLALLPGRHRVGLQGHEVDKMFPGVDRDAFTIENFSGWLGWAKSKKIGLDIAPAFYGHPKLDNSLSLAHPDRGIREFWINHGLRCREIGAAFGKALGTPAVVNFWAPDGFKDTPADRMAARKRLMASLDACFEPRFSEKYERDAVEAKLFGIGVESCTVGSHEFYLLYAATRGKMCCFDTGHFHPTEVVSDKLSAYFCMLDEVLLHVSRGVRWDSDHVTVLNDELLALARESLAASKGKKIHYMLDYFDASINRLAAWVIGARDFRKALLIALLEPKEGAEAEKKLDYTARLASQEAARTLPWGAVWQEFLDRSGVPDDFQVLQVLRDYEKRVLSRRN